MSRAKDASVSPPDLDWREWDFESDKLSNEELAACHAHEHGREIAKRCQYVMTQLKIVWRANELPAKCQQPGPDLRGLTLSNPKAPPKIKRHPERIRGDEAAFKLWMSSIPAETLGHRDAEKQSWYNLPEAIRKFGVQKIRERSGWKKGAPKCSVLLRTVREFEASGTETSDGFLCSDIQLLRELVRYETLFLQEIFSGGFYGDKTERGFFVIDWNVDLGVLKKQVFEWLEKQHSERKKVPPIAKHKPSRGQYREQLRWLGALRFKEHYRRKNLTEQNFQRVTRDSSPYQKMNDLYQAATKAKKILGDRIKEIERIGAELVGVS